VVDIENVYNGQWLRLSIKTRGCASLDWKCAAIEPIRPKFCTFSSPSYEVAQMRVACWFGSWRILWRYRTCRQGLQKLHLCLSGSLTALSRLLYRFHSLPSLPASSFLHSHSFTSLRQTQDLSSPLSQQSCQAHLQSIPTSINITREVMSMNVMDLVPRELEAGQEGARTQKKPRQLKAIERNNLIWDAYKNEIRSLYVAQDMTLKATIAWFELKHDFVKRQASSPLNVGVFADKP